MKSEEWRMNSGERCDFPLWIGLEPLFAFRGYLIFAILAPLREPMCLCESRSEIPR